LEVGCKAGKTDEATRRRMRIALPDSSMSARKTSLEKPMPNVATILEVTVTVTVTVLGDICIEDSGD
jgi:hypothetical protein